MDAGGTSDPYVKVYLAGEKKKQSQTKTVKKSLNPTFNETFKFQLEYKEIQQKTLVMEVYDFDKFSKDDEIGHVHVPLSSVNLASASEEWRDLLAPDQGSGIIESKGDICFSLRYAPVNGKLHIVILEAKDLPKMDQKGHADPFVKMSLYDGRKKLKKKKTTVKKGCKDPYFNESFAFDIPFESITRVTLFVTVMDHDRVGRNDRIGKVTLGSSSHSSGLRHWTDMLTNPRRPIAMWHSLEPAD